MDRVVRRGDEAAFGALYDRHTPYLYRLALRLTAGETATAADLVHDAWVTAAPRLGNFAGTSALRTWVAGFVVNLARRAWRDLSPPVGFHAEVEDPGFEAAVLARVDLDRGLAALPPGARQILVLHDLEGWTHAQIAAQLAVDVGTSKSQLSRARGLLRAQLGALDDSGGAP